MKEYINEILGKRFICPSNLSYTVSVLIIKKSERGLWVCVNYCALNT